MLYESKVRAQILVQGRNVLLGFGEPGEKLDLA